jgi:hypothetical protein
MADAFEDLSVGIAISVRIALLQVHPQTDCYFPGCSSLLLSAQGSADQASGQSAVLHLRLRRDQRVRRQHICQRLEHRLYAAAYKYDSMASSSVVIKLT